MTAFEEHRNLDLKKVRGTTKQILPVRLRRGEENLTKIVGHITANDEPFDLSGYGVRFAYINAGGGKFFRESEIEDAKNGVVSYTVGRELSDYDGIVQVAYFEITTPNGLVTSDTVPVMVENSADLTIEEGQGYQNDIDKLIEEMTKLLDEYARDLKDVVDSEAERKEAEQARDQAEQARDEAEQARDTSEKIREDNEQARNDAERLRDEAEQARASAESDRDEAEQAREDAEAQRKANEQQRIANETERQEAESKRNANEAQREKAESERAEAESDRDEAEQARDAAENERAAAEAARKQSEQDRENAEQQREADTQNAIAQTQEATRSANTAANAANTAANNANSVADELREARENGEFDGGIYTPHIEERGDEEILSWTNDRELPNPDPVNIRGKQGQGLTVLGSYPDYDSFIADHPDGKAGDAWIIDGDFYTWSDNHWQYISAFQGERGSRWYTGTEVYRDEQGNVIDEFDRDTELKYDLYLNTESYDVFWFDGAVWLYSFTFEGGGSAKATMSADVAIASTPANGNQYMDGETITATVTIQNQSVFSLFDVATSINDGWSLDGQTSIEEMRPGAIVELTATHQVTQDDYGKQTFACVVTTGNGLVTATGSSEFLPLPPRNVDLSVNIAITSEPDTVTGIYYTWDTVTFNTVITNSGNITLHNASAAFSLPGLDITGGSGYTVTDNGITIGTMQPGASVTVPCSLTIPESMAGQQFVSNTVTVTTDEQTKASTSGTFSVSSTVRSLSAAVQIANQGTGAGGVFVAGDTIQYNIVVSNPSGNTYHNITVTERMDGVTINDGVGYSVAGNVATLTDPMGQNGRVTITATRPVTQSDLGKTDIINTVDVYSDEKELSASSQAARMDERRVSASATKTITSTGTGDSGEYYTWDTVAYDIKVTNTGNITLTGIKVTEQLSGCVISNGNGYTVGGDGVATIATIEPKASVTVKSSYLIPDTDIGRTNIVNTVSVDGDEVNTTATAEGFNVSTEERGLQCSKTITNTGTGLYDAFTVGDTINYNISITNSSGLTYTNIEITEQLEGCTIIDGTDYSVSGGKATIASMSRNDSVTVKAQYPVKESDLGNSSLINTAQVKSGDTTITVSAPAPNIEAVLNAIKGDKTFTTTGTADGGEYYTGETVGFKIAVTNTGNTTLHDVEVAETLPGCVIKGGSGYTLQDSKAKIATLASKQVVNVTASYDVPEDDAGKPAIINTVNITANEASTTATASPFGVSSEVRTLELSKAITNTGTGVSNVFQKGNTIEYGIKVTNTGKREYDNIEVTEQLTGCTIVNGDGYTVSNGKAIISHIGSYGNVTVKAQYPVKESDLGNNNLKNTAKMVCGNIELEAESAAAAIEAIRKALGATVTITNTGTGTGGAFTVGNTVQFKATITNTGNVQLTNVQVNASL